MAASSWLTERMSTSSALRARRSVTVGSHRDAVVTEGVVEAGLVVSLPLAEPPDHQHARDEELAARVLPSPGRADGHTPRRDDATADLVARLGVDHRNGRVEDHALPQHRAPPDAGALGHHASAAHHGLV